MIVPGRGSDELSEEELVAPFLRVLDYAGQQAQTDQQRDVVMNALYDVFVRVGVDDGEDIDD
jgi:hypothetical protein